MTSEGVVPRRSSSLLSFGNEAAGGAPLTTLLRRACEEVTHGLGVSHAKVLRYQPEEKSLLVVAGIGWADDVVGHARLSPELQSPAGYALQTGQPTIANDLATEQRFAVPPLLAQHGVRSAANVIIRAGELVFGVLEADSREARQFDERDVQFLQGYANILALAVEQHRLADHNASLSRSLELALAELRHRARNNNQALLSVLAIQRRQLDNVVMQSLLDDVASRIRILSDLDDAMQASGEPGSVDVGKYLLGIVSHLCGVNAEKASRIALDTDVAQITLDTQRARALGLIVNEFLTNSFKYAFDDDGRGHLELSVRVDGDCLQVRLRDDGPGFDPAQQRGFGLNLIETLSDALGGSLRWQRRVGAALEIDVPLDDAKSSVAG